MIVRVLIARVGRVVTTVARHAVAVGNIEPPRWTELRDAAEAMIVVIGAGFLFDLWGLNRFTAADVQARVDASKARWALFWLLGFGTFLMAFTGRVTMFVGLFSVLKVTFESWAQLSRLFGWRSVNDRTAGATPPV